jgi:PAS domain S-box-containing protein
MISGCVANLYRARAGLKKKGKLLKTMHSLEHLKPVRKTVNHRSRLYRIADLIRCITAGLLITCFLTAVAAEAQADTTGRKQKVLVLNSYHRGYDWSDNIVEAIQAEFGKTDLEVELFFEYMDTMRYESVEASRYMKQLCEAKYAKADLDLIITTDDSALYFVLEHRDLHFPGIPVVFCGVQEAENSKPQNYDSVTGVIELYDYQATAKIALKLHPSAKRIVAITDGSEADLLREMALDDTLNNLDRKVEIDVLSLGGHSMSELLEKIEQLGSESILFLVSAFRDKEGVVYTRQESARLIRQHCKAPIYVTGLNWLGLGPVGGMVAYAAFQGREAAKMAIRILNGENPQNIPILQESPNAYMFDYIQLKRFGISPSELPEGSIIINEPKSFYYQYKKPIWIVSAVITALVAMVLVLSISILKRRQAERALRESQALFYGFMDQLPVTAFMKDEKGRVQYVNPYMIEKLGADKWLDHTAIDYYPPEVAEGVLAHDNRALAEGPSAREEWVPDKDGDIRCMHTHKFPIRRQDKPPLIGGMAIDITERKEAEDALRVSENKYRTLLENLPQKIFLKDKNSVYISCNESYASDMKIKPEEIAGKTDYDFYPKELAEKYRADDKRILESGQVEDIEEKYIQHGQEIIVHTVKTPLKDEQGNTLGLLGIFWDITERKRQEKELKDSEERFRTIFDNAADGILLADIETRKFYTGNRVIYQMLGYSSEELRNMTISDIHPKQHLPYVMESFEKQTRKEKALAKDIPVKRKDGSIFYADINAFPVTLAGKTYLMGVFRDITDIRQREQELALYREKMVRAEQLASMGTLSATLAHELTQPLTVIRLSIENLLEELKTASCPDTVTEELIDSLAGIVDAAAIVDRFRDFARKSSEKTFGKVELKAIVEKIVELLNESAKRANLALLIRNMNELPPVHSNERDIAQMFFALIENAIQAADGRKQRRLTITGNLKNEHVRLSFSDNCGGIAPKNLDRIFEPFFTTGSDGTRTGLGLCIVKKILSECGGDIQVDSRFGRGTTFYVTLPLRSEKSNEDF